jgi:ligand-binding sensor domain-containing protein
MKKRCLLFILFCIFPMAFSQNSQPWKGYFSYNEIKDLAQSPTNLIAASENALFSKNITTNTLKTTNTIDGLSGETITTIYHSAAFNKTILGYENGLMIIINEKDGSMLNVVDIITNSVSQSRKGINHFMEKDGVLYVSCNFGIVQYKLATLGFGDTYRIGDLGAEIKVTQTASFNGYIYAATTNGIRRALLTNPFLNDYNQWEQVESGDWLSIENFGNELMAVSTSGTLYRFNGSQFIPFLNFPTPPNDLRGSGDYLLVTTPNSVSIYNQNLGLVKQINSSQVNGITAKFTCATLINETVYIGTLENGVTTTTLNNTTSFEFMNPDGPSRNSIFAINATTPDLWAVYGGYSSNYNPYTYTPTGVSTYGFSKYSENSWKNTSYSSVLGAKALSRVTVNPKNNNQVYISSYFSGLLKVENDLPTLLYNQTNSALESLVLTPPNPNYVDIRINESVFDKAGNLWMTNGLIENGLKVLKTNGQWQSYNMKSILVDYFDTRFGRIAIDKNGTKWICARPEGLIAFNENGSIFKKISSGDNAGNLPSPDVRALAIDNDNRAWIGTRKGLRVLSSVDRFLSAGQMNTTAIIIEEEGVARELLYEQFITDIVVDGANNKWVGTADSGVFMFSPDGQKTFYHFTVSNSPLPSNTINDIDINGTTGEVFIATTKGMVSFKGSATDANDNLNNVVVFPNPVRPGFEGTVKISGLLDQCNVKITDIEGSLVYEAISEGGTLEWDTKAFGKYKVASGVYLILISAKDGSETKVKKVMIVR